MRDLKKAVAEEYGVSSNEVKEEMEKAIRMAMENSDPDAQKFWGKLSPDGAIPEVEDVVSEIIKMLSH